MLPSTEPDHDIEEVRARKLAELMRRGEEAKRREKLGTDGMPVVLSDGAFDMIKQYPLMLVDFWAAWCGPCRIVAPIVDEVARDHRGNVWVGKLNVDENPVTAEKFRVQSIPTLILFKNGLEVDRIVGAVPKNLIESRLRVHTEQS